MNLICPKCGSDDIDCGLAPDDGITVGISVFRFFCMKCHKRWYDWID